MRKTVAGLFLFGVMLMFALPYITNILGFTLTSLLNITQSFATVYTQFNETVEMRTANISGYTATYIHPHASSAYSTISNMLEPILVMILKALTNETVLAGLVGITLVGLALTARE